MIKIYTTNKNGNIELTKQELMELIEEVKRECREEKPQSIIPECPTEFIMPECPTEPIWTPPYCATAVVADDNRHRKNDATSKGEIFLRLAKELSFQ